jgi:hypothetical protein
MPAVGLVLGVALGVTGCGPRTGTVSGKVTYKDQTLRGGRVTFVTPDGVWGGNVEIQEDGSYAFDKVPPGPVKAAVDTRFLAPRPAPAGVKMPAPPPEAEKYGPPVAKNAKERYVKIPDQYANPDTSDLTYTVTPGSQTINIELK